MRRSEQKFIAKPTGKPEVYTVQIRCIHIATARRVRNLFNRLGLEEELVFTGGVSNNAGMKKVLEEILGHKISEVKLNTIYAGALGAAVIAQKSFASAAQDDERQEAVNGAGVYMIKPLLVVLVPN